ncbi:MAG: tRNA isopentenyl-2-thiomethyl-A-37 hydroxylase MiaE, partial [Cyanobacteria bacterium P01_C01_bin.147]
MVAAASIQPRIKFLQVPTSQAWVEQAIANLDIILLD